MTLPNRVPYLVIGAGIHGLSTAWQLARRLPGGGCGRRNRRDGKPPPEAETALSGGSGTESYTPTSTGRCVAATALRFWGVMGYDPAL